MQKRGQASATSVPTHDGLSMRWDATVDVEYYFVGKLIAEGNLCLWVGVSALLLCYYWKVEGHEKIAYAECSEQLSHDLHIESQNPAFLFKLEGAHLHRITIWPSLFVFLQAV